MRFQVELWLIGLFVLVIVIGLNLRTDEGDVKESSKSFRCESCEVERLDQGFIMSNLVSSPHLSSFWFCKDFENFDMLSDLDCNNKTIEERLRLALIMENCGVAMKGRRNAHLVAQKLRKLAENNQFVFFRGVAGLFDYNMMCSEEPETTDKGEMKIPTVLSNGDCHPENFGVMVEANDKLIWGVNDFDQGFNAPFTWDLKRGVTGFLVGCMSGGYDPDFCLNVASSFLDHYLRVFKDYPGCQLLNEERFIEGSKQSKKYEVILDLFAKARERDDEKETKKWFKKKGVDVENEQFFETDDVKPIDNNEIPKFQEAINAYLFHGTPATAKFPTNGNFYEVKDAAEKLGSGTGSVGLNRFYLLIKGRRTDNDVGNIILEMKEQSRSILENFFSYYVPPDQEAKRAVDSETAAFPYANVFYGWTRFKGNPYVVREKSKHQVSQDQSDLYEKDAKINQPFNDKFYTYINQTDTHTVSSEKVISHKHLASKVYETFLQQRLLEIEENENGDLTKKLSDLQLHMYRYAEAAGLALGFYHIRARCENQECPLKSNAFVDVDTCAQINTYLKGLEEGSLEAMIMEFAIAETMREEHSWRLLRDIVKSKTEQKRSVLELLVSR